LFIHHYSSLSLDLRPLRRPRFFTRNTQSRGEYFLRNEVRCHRDTQFSDPKNAGEENESAMSKDKKKDEILHDHNHDGIDRRGFLKCMAWAGTGAFCVIQGGILKSYSLSSLSAISEKEPKGELSFVQISDSHMGFNKPANPNVAATLKAAVDKINALPV